MGGEDSEKLIRIPGDTLLIKVSKDEEEYRKKYLPDVKRLTDEKLVCTVCSVSLAQNIHKGKDLYIHRALQVLVCEACFNFYGDGCFSADEDGDDKYCRWCGQGGTLYLCSACNCAFCQKCTKQNLKASVLADLENDDWKCYICNPRPLFGCRTICWGAQQLNKIGKEKEQERQKKIKERLEKLEAKKKEAKPVERKSRKASSSEDEGSIKKRRRSSDSSSPEVMPKRRKRDSRDSKSLNGSIRRRRKDSSSHSESEGEKKVTRRSKSSIKKERIVHSSSEDESDNKSKKDTLRKKKKKKDTSDESSDTSKRKSKQRLKTKKVSTDEDTSEDEKSKKKKKQSIKKRDDSTDSSSGERKKKKLKKKKKSTSSEESSEETKQRNKKKTKKKTASSSDKSSDEEESSKSGKTKSKHDKDEITKKQDTADSESEFKKGKKLTNDSEEVSANSAEDVLVKKRIKLAILWLSTIVKDISELGTLISLRATKFCKKKINAENLKSYEDVLNCVSKVKQLISGVHSNYDHIEKTLDSHLKPWKILTGLEDQDNEKNFVDGDSTVSENVSVLKPDETIKSVDNNDKDKEIEMNGIVVESKGGETINEKTEESLNNWSDDSEDQKETRALISKANETLDKSQHEDEQSETSTQIVLGDKGGDKKEKDSNEKSTVDVEESKPKCKTTKSDSEKPAADSKLEMSKKSPCKIDKDTKENQEKTNDSRKGAESDSENDIRPSEKSSPLKNNSDGEGKNREDSGSGDEKDESKGNEKNKQLQNDHGVMENKQDSSDEESGFNSFASRLKDKWLSGTSTEEMNLKKSSEIDFKKKEGEEKFPKVIVTKLKLGKSDEVSVKTEEKTGKRASSAKKQTKSESRGRALSSEDEEGDSKEIEKLKVDKTKIKSETKDKKVNTLSSSDDESQSQGVEVRNVVHKNKREKKEDAGNKNTRKSEQTKEDGKHIIENASRSSNKKEDKLKCDSSDKDNKANKHRTGYKDNVEKKEKTQVKNLSSDDEDKDKRNTRKTGPTKEKEGKVTESTRSRSSEKKKKENEIKCDIKGEDSKANKQKDIPENKSKKLSKQEDESDDDTSKANDRRSKSRDTRKGKIKENSDDEVTNNKKQKLKESNQSKDTKNTDSKENSEEEETKENEGKGTENTRSRSSVKKEKEHKMEYDKSGEDSKANKQKYVSENKSKKRIKNEDESDDDINRPSTTDDHKSKSKDTRKSKMEANSDNEVTKNKKQKLKEFKESKDTKKVFDSKENCEEETANNTSMETKKSNKSKNSNEIEEDKQDSSSKKAKTINEKRKVLLDSSDEEQMDSVVENGETISVDVDGEKTTTERQRNAELIEIDSDEKDYTLELQASSTENTNNIEMVEEKENNFEGKEGENILEKPEIDSSCKEKVETKEITKTKFVGFDSSSDEEVQPKVISKKIARNRSVRNQRKSQTKLVLSSDDEDEETKVEGPVHIESSDDNEEKGGKEKDVDFSVTLGISSESSDSDILPNNKRKKTKSSDSDVSISSSESKKKKKRRRIKLADSSDESGGSGDEKSKGQKNNDGESPAKGGRKNIKKIKKKGDLEQTTITAAEEEKERRKRIEERQKLFNQVFEIKESAKLEKLVLDFDPETKKELISVNKDLVAKMKPHQAKGVKFMWDSCFESVKQIKKTKGSGCILAHCMGLGKTFQVVSLVHTLLTHEELTKVRTVMVVCPLSTVLNWVNEFAKWLEDIEGGDDIEVFHLTKYIKNPDRARELRRWQHNGGVLIMGYEMFRNLTNETTKKFKAKMKKDFLETLIDPGADLIVCDEGHMLKNEATALSKAMTRVRTLRRIVLTGTPMQNNLKEYHCMVQFVKPNLLGTSKEFLNRFVNPINNGQFVDSTDHDVKLMKRRAHVLHKMLEGLVQRFDYNVLTPFLPPKQEYVISVCLSELQEKLYSHYLENESQKAEGMKGGTRLFMDWQTLGRVWTHPRVLKMSTDKANWLKEKKAMEASDSEGSLRDFIDDDSDKSTTSPESSSEDDSSSDGGKKKKKPVHKSRSTRATRQSSSVALLESSDEEKRANEAEDALEDTPNKGEWWCSFVEPQHFEDMRQSGKLLLLFAILKECELIEDKVLVFSQSLFSLDLIEYFLDKIDAATQEGRLDENLDNHQGTWSKGLDYFRLDGSTSSENRNIWCKAFNREDNPRARLFLISTRAGGLGINLTAANRVIIFDASWNPSHDIQSIFRIYRFGQKKPCYVYRFVAYGTMEEKVYERQVAKQSISNRVVDEQQVHRHFSMNDLTELYTFTPASKLDERPTPTLPRDPLMAEILSQMKQWIEKYHEHDSLLENVVEEELNEEERKAAWEDYENDKKRGFMPPAGPQGPAMNPNAAWNQQIEIMRQQLKLRYGDKSDDEINQILVYQVSIMMRQQQQQQMQMAAAAQMQAAGNMGYRPQMYGNNAMFNQRPQMQTTAYLRNIAPKPASQQNYTPDQVYRMQQQANLARLQLQQMAAQQKSQSQPRPTTLQTLLQGAAASKYPTANIPALQRMKQNYQAPSQDKPGVTITEILDDKPSGSSES